MVISYICIYQCVCECRKNKNKLIIHICKAREGNDPNKTTRDEEWRDLTPFFCVGGIIFFSLNKRGKFSLPLVVKNKMKKKCL